MYNIELKNILNKNFHLLINHQQWYDYRIANVGKCQMPPASEGFTPTKNVYTTKKLSTAFEAFLY